jgi:hypothetical protein
MIAITFKNGETVLVQDMGENMPAEVATRMAQAYACGERPTIVDAEALPAPVDAETKRVGNLVALESTRQALSDAGVTGITPLSKNGIGGHGTSTHFHGGVKYGAQAKDVATGALGGTSYIQKQAAKYLGWAEKKRVEHDRKASIEEAGEELSALVRGEGRRDQEVSAAELGNALSVNGKITAFGYALSEQAIRGMAARLESPFLSYALALRERVGTAAASGDLEACRQDKAMIADVLRHECKRNPDARLVLRTRKDPGDIFAIVSPSYAPADAPEVVREVIAAMPFDAKGSFAYDQHTTQWELRANVWTAKDAGEHAVGEPLEGFSTFRSRDNGTGRLNGGGGITILACFNTACYVANQADVNRVHRGKIMRDVQRMLREATKAIDVLCNVWGVQRERVVGLPLTDDGKAIPIEKAIPGFWRHLLRDRSSELANVLPGRTADHVEGLSRRYFEQRRDEDRIVVADFAQSWTRHIQDIAPDARRDAEQAIGTWLQSARPHTFRCEVK